MAVPLISDGERSEKLQNALKDFGAVVHNLDNEGVSHAGFKRLCSLVGLELKTKARTTTPDYGSAEAAALGAAHRYDEELAWATTEVFNAFSMAEMSLIRSQRDPDGRIANFPLYFAAKLALDPENISIFREDSEQFPWWEGEMEALKSSFARELASQPVTFSEIWTVELGTERSAKPALSLS